MNIKSQILAIVVTVCFGLCSEAKIANEFQVRPISRHDLASLLATTCSNEGWKSYSKWSQRQLSSKAASVQTPIHLKIDGNTISVENKLSIEVVDKNTFVAKMNGQTVSATDPCDLFVGLVEKKKVSSLSQIFLEAAQAEPLVVEEGNTLDYCMIGASAALTVWALVPPFEVIGLVAGVGGMDYFATPILSKREFASILNSKFDVDCTDTTMVISTPERKIVVSKTLNYTVDIVDNKNQSVESNASTSRAAKSHDYVVGLAKSCNNKEDAQHLSESIRAVQARGVERMASLDAVNSNSGGGTESKGVL